MSSTNPLQASSRATAEAAAASATPSSTMAPASPPPATRQPSSSGTAKSPPSRVEIQRKLSSAGSRPEGRGRMPSTLASTDVVSPQRARPMSTSPNSTDTESEGYNSGGGGGAGGAGGAGQINLASISEGEDDVDSDEDDRKTVGSEDRSQMQGLNNEQTVLSGYLEKKGERRKTWKKRWFVLRRTTLVYYKNNKEYRLLRMIPLNEVHTCAQVQVKNHSNTFGIVTPKRTYYVRAKSADQMESWIDRVNEATEALKNTGATSPGADDEVPTPKGSETPVGHDSNQRQASQRAQPQRQESTKPISILIPGAGGSSQGQFQPSSVSSTTTSGLGSETLSSSYASQSSSGFSGGVPPNSAVSNHSTPLGRSPDLGEVDHNLERLTTQTPGESRQAKGSTASSQGQAEYFGRQPSSDRKIQPPPSPAFVMSSSDEDDDDDVVHKVERAVAMPDAGKTIIQGYLMKQGKRKNWRKRFFTLTSGQLSYSKSHMDMHGRAPRRIPVAKILDAIEHNPASASSGQANPPSSPLTGHFNFPTAGGGFSDTRAADNCFKIITSQRTYLVAAPTEEDEIRWLSALQCLLATRRSSMNSPPQKQSDLPSGSQAVSPPPSEATVQQNQSLAAPNPANASPATTRRPSHGALPSITSALIAGDTNPGVSTVVETTPNRQRSATDAAKASVRDVEHRYQASRAQTGTVQG